MGAETFEQFERRQGDDDTVEKAFGRAVERAAYDYGHAGYTGTLAEKHDVVLIAGDGGAVQRRYGRAYFPVSAYGGARQDVEWPETDPVDLTTARATADRLIESQDERVDDKWGPAGAIRVKDEKNDGWWFFGWASS